jgi:hypothetical protein
MMITFQTVDPNVNCSGCHIWLALLGQHWYGSELWIVSDGYIGMAMGAWAVNEGQLSHVDLFPAISDKRIHTLATTLNETNHYCLYLDGVMIASRQFLGAQFNIYDAWLYLGKDVRTSGPIINALFYKAQLWDVALTASQMDLAVRGDASAASRGQP